VETLWAALRATGTAHLAALDRLATDYLGDRGELEVVTRAELADRLRRGEVPVVLDVRPVAEYAAGHIPGALSVPLPELAKRLSELRKGRDVVAYCRGPYCVLAVEAVKLLRRKGFRAVRLEQGVLDWAALGLPVETTSA
jgi:rhodanese-related sulfurtransferase